ncbi:hypothetical protein Tco_0488717 [Tanacetum coccineum]
MTGGFRIANLAFDFLGWGEGWRVMFCSFVAGVEVLYYGKKGPSTYMVVLHWKSLEAHTIASPFENMQFVFFGLPTGCFTITGGKTYCKSFVASHVDTSFNGYTRSRYDAQIWNLTNAIFQPAHKPDGGFDVCMDLIGSSPLTQTEMIDFVPGRAVIDATHCKRVKYEARCANTGYGFLPFSFSSHEELEKDAVALLKRIPKYYVAKDIGARAVVHIFTKISFF